MAAALVAVAVTIALVPLAGAAPSAALTPDQRFTRALSDARSLSKSTYRRLKSFPPVISDVNRAKADLNTARASLRTSTGLAPLTVGATEKADLLADLKTAAVQTGLAANDVKKGDYSAARAKIDRAVAAETSALASFGVPLAREFPAFAVYRELANIYGFEEYLGLTARVGSPITKVVIGIAGREAANAGEPGGARGTPSIPITKIALYTLQEPSGEFSSGWCRLVNGIMICKLNRTMQANEAFSVAFAPRVAAGTKFLVKFWSTDGKRSYAVMTTR